MTAAIPKPAETERIDADALRSVMEMSEEQFLKLEAETLKIDGGRTYCPQPGPQTELIKCDCDEIFFGGARGGGKSAGSLIDWLEHERKYRKHANGIVFRRSLIELEELIADSFRFFTPAGAEWRESKKTWIFPSGARLKFRYLLKDKDAEGYMGHSYTWILFEEAGNFASPAPIDLLRATLRSAHGAKSRMLLTGNPGGPGHNWLKARYIDPAEPKTVIEWKYWNKRLGKTQLKRRIFLPSKLEDNKILMDSDPDYEANLARTGPEWLVKAWLSGDWNIVAGGRFDHLFTPESLPRIVLPFFRVPKGWRVDRSFDWGKSKPFSVGWWAQSDGSPARMSDGTELFLPRGSLIRISEWYGCKNGKPNVGIGLTSAEVARKIIEHDKMLGYDVKPGPADVSIFSSDDDLCIADKMSAAGCMWTPSGRGAKRSRVNGWEVMETMLTAACQNPREEPGLFVMENCRAFLQTVPLLPRDQRNWDDVDTDAEDHVADEVRYRVMTKIKTSTTTRGVFR